MESGIPDDGIGGAGIAGSGEAVIADGRCGCQHASSLGERVPVDGERMYRLLQCQDRARPGRQCLTVRDLVNIADQYPVKRARFREGRERPVPLRMLTYPRVRGVRQVVRDDVDDPVVPRGELLPVLGVVQRLRVPLVIHRGLHEDEAPREVVKLLQAHLKHVQLVPQHERVEELRAGQGPSRRMMTSPSRV